MAQFIYATPVRAWGGIVGTAQLRFAPDDFVVSEDLGFEADGAGEHALLHIRKRGVNTDWLARRLARYAGARVADVGFCGLKDRHAVTTQWFSVPSPIAQPIDWSPFKEEGVDILASFRHSRKLRRGSHRANRFSLTLRHLSVDRAQLQLRLERIAQQGMPNYFGVQRFGREGRNVEHAQRWLLEGEKKPDRHQRSLWLSAVRSYLFNNVLSERTRQTSWNTLLPGERVMLDGTHSVFTATTLDDELNHRCEDLDVHPTGPLAGTGDHGCEGDALALERLCLADYEAICDALGKQKVKLARRALRVRVDDLRWSFFDDDAGPCVTLEFGLPSGSYATVLIDELVEQDENL